MAHHLTTLSLELWCGRMTGSMIGQVLCGGVVSHGDNVWPAHEAVNHDKKLLSTIAAEVYNNLLKRSGWLWFRHDGLFAVGWEVILTILT